MVSYFFGYCVQNSGYKNDFIIKKLQYALTMELFKSGQVGESDVEKAKKEFKLSEQQFMNFWKSVGVSD